MRKSVDEIPQLMKRRLQTGGAWLWEANGVPVGEHVHLPRQDAES